MFLPVSYDDFRLFADRRGAKSPPPAPPRRPGRRGTRRLR
jgi:hypothetical protein